MSDIFDKIASDFKSNRKSSFLTQPLRTRYDYGERVSSSFNDLDQDNDDYLSILGDIAKIQQQWNKSIDFFTESGFAL